MKGLAPRATAASVFARGYSASSRRRCCVVGLPARRAGRLLRRRTGEGREVHS